MQAILMFLPLVFASTIQASYLQKQTSDNVADNLSKGPKTNS